MIPVALSSTFSFSDVAQLATFFMSFSNSSGVEAYISWKTFASFEKRSASAVSLIIFALLSLAS